MPLLLGLLGAEPGVVGQSVTRLIVQDEVILRVPVQPRPLMPEIEWVEHKGPKCVPAAAIRRALLSGPDQVDFMLANRARVRAQFDEDCPALDFYGGFYLQPRTIVFASSATPSIRGSAAAARSSGSGSLSPNCANDLDPLQVAPRSLTSAWAAA